MKKHLLNSLLIIPTTLLLGCNQASQEPENDIHLRPVQVMKIADATNASTTRFSGVVRSIDTAKLSFRVPGTLENIFVNVGQHVKKGYVIASIDPHDYKVQQAELTARLTEAKSTHKLATIELRRVKQAIANNATAQVNLDRAISGFERSKAAVEVVQQNLNKANDAIRYANLTAPFDGVIGQQSVQSFEQVVPGIPVFTLHKPESLEVVIDVPENLAHRFNSALTASLSWYGSNETIPVSITDIGSVPNMIKQTYPVTFKLKGYDASLLPGKSVNVNVAIAQLDKSFCLPYSAIISNKNTQKVFVINNKKVEEKTIKVTQLSSDTACVSGSLKAGDNVVVLGASYLQSGDTISTLTYQNENGELL